MPRVGRLTAVRRFKLFLAARRLDGVPDAEIPSADEVLDALEVRSRPRPPKKGRERPNAKLEGARPRKPS